MCQRRADLEGVSSCQTNLNPTALKGWVLSILKKNVPFLYVKNAVNMVN